MSSVVVAVDNNGEGDDASMDDTKKQKKGRGFTEQGTDNRYELNTGEFDSLIEEDQSKSHALKSIEGWIVFVTNIHEEAQEDDIYEVFAECGEVKQIHLNLDRRTGYVKGYALIEYEKFKEAQKAIDTLNATQILERTISVDWAFTKVKHSTSSRDRQRSPRRKRRDSE